MEKSRLRKKNMRTIKANSYFSSLHSIILKTGDCVDFQVRLLANRPWYSIIQEFDYGSSSYYDGPDFETAFDFYIEFVLAFKGIAFAEKVKKLKPKFELQTNQLLSEISFNKYDDMYQSLKRDPLFLGMSDF
jgi:hypothetical protein